MEQCYQGHADGRYSKLLTRLNNSDLLLLDDWGWNLSHQNSVATCWK